MKLLLENWRKFLNEGGNVFVGQTASIPKEFIEPTLEKYRKELNRLFPLKKEVFSSFRPVGSVGKKPTSGDIDLAGDATSFFPTGEVTPEELKSWNINPTAWKDTFSKFKTRARSRTDAELGWRAFLTELAKYINENSELIITDPKKVGPGIMFSLFPQFSDENKQQDIGVQIDWMVGRADWLEFAYYSDPPSKKDSYLKGLHRTQLMLAMFSVKNVSYHHSSFIKTPSIITPLRFLMSSYATPRQSSISTPLRSQILIITTSMSPISSIMSSPLHTESDSSPSS